MMDNLQQNFLPPIALIALPNLFSSSADTFEPDKFQTAASESQTMDCFGSSFKTCSIRTKIESNEKNSSILI